jgi:PHS family inorganic phosphate transporter-like MFS transporter
MANEARRRWISAIVTSASNFSVQYNFQAMSVALIIMSTSECTATADECERGQQASWVGSMTSATVFIGATAGQLTMGYLGDAIGRNAALKISLILATIGALGSAILPTGTPSVIYSVIVGFRLILGIGVGGVYPLSATKAAEDSGKSGEVTPIASAFSFFWQTPGSVAPWVIALLISRSALSTGAKWRLVLGLGAIPSVAVVAGVVLADSLEEQPTTESVGLIGSETHDPPAGAMKQVGLWEALKEPINQRKLMLSGGSWFLFDVCYYGVTLFGAEMLNDMATSAGSISSDESVRTKSLEQILALSLGAPAVLLSVWMMARGVRLRALQIIGFLGIALSFVLLALLYSPLHSAPSMLYVVYCVLLFFLSFGPNVTTFVLPASLYPVEIRSSFNGLSAACGKLGAVAGAQLFGLMHNFVSYPVILLTCAVVATTGATLTYGCLPEVASNADRDVGLPSSSNEPAFGTSI